MKIIKPKITGNSYLIFSSIEKKSKFEFENSIDTTVVYAEVVPKEYLGENIFDTSELLIISTPANFGTLIIPNPAPSEEEIIEIIKNYPGTIYNIVSEQPPEEVGSDNLFKEISLRSGCTRWIYNEISHRPYYLSDMIKGSIVTYDTSGCNRLYIPTSLYEEYKSMLDFWNGDTGTTEEKLKIKRDLADRIFQKVSSYPFTISEGNTDTLTLVAEREGLIFLKVPNEDNIMIQSIKSKNASVVKGIYYYGPYTIDNFLEPLVKQLKRIGF